MPMNGRPDPDPGYSPGAITQVNYRMLPPSGPLATITVNGRQYVGTPGTPKTVPDYDGRVLEANGWQLVAISGPTSSRPINASHSPYRTSPGLQFYDETLGKIINYDAGAAVWRDPTSGAAV